MEVFGHANAWLRNSTMLFDVFQGSSCFFFSPMFFEQPRTKQSSNKVAWLQVALCPSWDRGMMNEWMNEWNTVHYNAMKWISKEHRQTCSLCFWRWSSCVRGWTWLGLLTHGSNGYRVTETTASIPQSWSSLAAQKHQHLVFKLVQLPATTYCVSWAVSLLDEPVHYTTGLCIASIWREASCGPPAGASIHSGRECHDGLLNTFFVCISSRWAGLLKLHGKCMEFGHVNMCPWTGHHVQISGLANVGSLFPFRFYFWAKSSLILLLLLAISQLQRLR